MDCMLYANNRFVDLSASSPVTSCVPSGISALNTSLDKLQVVGQATTPTENEGVAFVATLSSSGTGSLNAFTSNVPSRLIAPDDENHAVGFSYYAPIGGFYQSQPIFGLQGQKFSPLQPTCTKSSLSCATGLEPVGSPCPVAGCVLNDNGVVLIDLQYKWRTVNLYGKATAPGCSGVHSYGYYGPVLISNYGCATTFNVSTGSGADSSLVVAGQMVTPCFGCFFSISSFSNSGYVLGNYTDAGGNNHNYTWDPTHGLQNIGYGTNSRMTLLAANDAGQILVSFLSPRNIRHWGLLNPKR